MPRITITTTNSTKVKPCCLVFMPCSCLIEIIPVEGPAATGRADTVPARVIKFRYTYNAMRTQILERLAQCAPGPPRKRDANQQPVVVTALYSGGLVITPAAEVAAVYVKEQFAGTLPSTCTVSTSPSAVPPPEVW
jgi:hypothetical protein